MENSKKKLKIQKTKKCTVCCKNKPFNKDYYYRNASHVSGFYTRCKVCVKEIRQRNAKLSKEKRKIIMNKCSDGKQDLNNLPPFDIEKELIRDNKIYHTSFIYCGQSRSGKTNNFIYNFNKIQDRYDIKILITESTSAAIYDKFPFDLISSPKKNRYKKVVNTVRYIQNKLKSKLNILIVLDDFSKRNCTLIRNLYTNGRNMNVTIISLIQSTTMINNHCRQNANYIIVFNQKNSEAAQKIYDFFLKSFITPPAELKTRYEKEKWIINWYQKSSENYKPLVLNVDRGIIQISTSEKI